MNEKLPSLTIGKYTSELPIIQGGMSVGLTGGELASAVANADSFGVIGGVAWGAINPDVKNYNDYVKADEAALREQINIARENSNDGNIFVNLMTSVSNYEQSVKTVIEAGAKGIISGAGLPSRLPEFVKKYKVPGQPDIELIPIVSSVRAAEIIIKKWQKHDVLPSAIIVETPNSAGGHLGAGTMTEVGDEKFDHNKVIPEMVSALQEKGLNIPVIAAGGIWDRLDVDKMLALGAAGVQVGTQFLVTDECNASDEFKDAHIKGGEITLIDSPAGLPGRVLSNDFVKRIRSGEDIKMGSCINCLSHCTYRQKLGGFCISRALVEVLRGDVEGGLLFTGSNGHRLHELGRVSAKQVIKLLSEYNTKNLAHPL